MKEETKTLEFIPNTKQCNAVLYDNTVDGSGVFEMPVVAWVHQTIDGYDDLAPCVWNDLEKTVETDIQNMSNFSGLKFVG